VSGSWSVDKEPFVSGADTMIDRLVASILNSDG
jgi:hypothetical protein